jgi:tetratricopeptide (TPR) repeat protein
MRLSYVASSVESLSLACFDLWYYRASHAVRTLRKHEMWRVHLLLAFLLTAAWSAVACPAWSQEPTDAVATDATAESVEDTSKEDSASAKEGESVDSRAIAFEAMDQIIEVCKNTGDAESAAAVQVYRDQFPGDDESRSTLIVARDLHKVIVKLRNRNELLTAEKLVPTLLRLGAATIKEWPGISLAAHVEAGKQDTDLERYDSALEHYLIALRIAEKAHLDQPVLIASQANRASALCMLKRYNEAEQIYLNLIQQTKESADEFSDDNVYGLKVMLAMAYRYKGDYRKCVETMPQRREVNDNTQVNLNRDFTLGIASVNLAMSDGETVEKAAELGQQLIDETQETFGVSSPEYIEALELMAAVRTEQEDYVEAGALLNKSASLRARLLGDGHPSVTRVRKKISAAIAKQSEQPIWEPGTVSDVETPDRYGEAEPQTVTK